MRLAMQHAAEQHFDFQPTQHVRQISVAAQLRERQVKDAILPKNRQVFYLWTLFYLSGLMFCGWGHMLLVVVVKW